MTDPADQAQKNLKAYLLKEFGLYQTVGRECALAYLSALTSAAFLCSDPASADAIRDFRNECEAQRK